MTNDDYQVGGALPLEATNYVVRAADQELYLGLRGMRFCYVLNSRQMGKSSLLVRTMKRLQDQGFACVEMEMRDICSFQINQEEFYGTMVSHLVSGFALDLDEAEWWYRYEYLSPFDRFSKFVDEEVLGRVAGKIAIFIDEIDSILNLDFKDDLFGFIRTCYNKRASQPKYQRLTFALLGVATPSDLIADNQRTPFNFDSLAIELKGFTPEEAKPLVRGLQGKVRHPDAVLQAILNWTGGQPFLTQKVCRLVCQAVGEQREQMLPYTPHPTPHTLPTGFVDQVVRSHILDNWLSQDNPEHLRTIRDRVLSGHQDSQPLLMLYHRILKGKKVPADQNHLQQQLRLSGLVVKRGGQLQVANRIYASVFDRHWVNQQLQPIPSPSSSLPRWRVIAATVGVTVLVMGMRSLGVWQSWEFQTFDWFGRSRQPEEPDQRLLLVQITRQDIANLGNEYPLHDRTMRQLLQALDQYQPQLIGLDIYRDRPEGKGQGELIEYLKTRDRVIPICTHPNQNDPEGISPPPQIPDKRLGFSDVITDSDSIVRRHLLAMNPPQPSNCSAYYAFSSQIALRYLQNQGFSVDFPTAKQWQIGGIRFNILNSHPGFYTPSQVKSHQIMLNYRRTEEIAPTVTLTQVLNHQVNPALIQNKIILIGVTDPSVKDYFKTPDNQEIRGLHLHAHKISQLISAVTDKRSLLQFPPWWIESLWIGTWALSAGLINWRISGLIYRGIASGIILISIGGVSFIIFITLHLYLPLTPSIFAHLITNLCTVKHQTHKHQPNPNPNR
ncbi:CHASE2 domain-containing protein [Coleofasciculus chthonoplastes]|uniref:CHASE2 domain-containing protein n=1 Tax=Coleofasciculus chthonoplastes TaxID=64178 RepID=UPI0032F111C1